MSLGGGGESQLMSEAIDYAHSKGVVIIAAAGNPGESSTSYPARYPHVIGVSALAPTTKKPLTRISAQGLTLQPRAVLKWARSCKIPFTRKPAPKSLKATKALAWLLPTLQPLQPLSMLPASQNRSIRSILLQSSRTVTEDPLNHFGSGHLDAAAAVQPAQRGQINFRDFFRWLRDNGYLSPRFWIDGGAVALLPKIAMVWFLPAGFLYAELFSLPLDLGLFRRVDCWQFWVLWAAKSVCI